MSVLFTIELRVSYSDEEKYKIAKRAVQQAALHAYATATLLGDKPADKLPEVSVYSHDFINGHVDIPLREEFTPKERVEIDAASARVAAALITRGGSGRRKPVLRLVEGGRPPDEE
jgi:hypothetical protein